MNIIDEFIVYDKNSKKKSIQVVELLTDNLEEVKNLQNSIAAATGKQIYEQLTEQEIDFILREGGIMIGAYEGTRLIAYNSVLFPGSRSDNLGREINIKENELNQVAHMESVAVRLDFRGNSLQLILALQLLQMVKDRGRYKHLAATVSPYNQVSVKNTFKMGMYIAALKKKYGGNWRYIFYQNLKKPLQVEGRDYINVDERCIESQKEILDKGYLGIRQEKKVSGTEIVFSGYRAGMN